MWFAVINAERRQKYERDFSGSKKSKCPFQTEISEDSVFQAGDFESRGRREFLN